MRGLASALTLVEFSVALQDRFSEFGVGMPRPPILMIYDINIALFMAFFNNRSIVGVNVQ